MDQSFRISVVIPVYNAAPYVSESVKSALDQPETAEVILIEDGSADNSLAECQKLLQSDHRIKLYTHPGNKNLGASASRNLGILNATSDFIAFLDADDIFLPSRFETTKSVFNSLANADGVYETIGTLYADETLRTKHLKRVRSELTGLSQAVAPESLFNVLATGKYGHLHLNGLVVKKRAITSDLQFDTALRQCQDSDWILRLASKRKLLAGSLKQPIALRRVHRGNRVLNSPEAIIYQRKHLRKCIQNDFYGCRDVYTKLYVVARYVSWHVGGVLRRLGIFSQPLILIFTGLYLLLHPMLLYRLLFKN